MGQEVTKMNEMIKVIVWRDYGTDDQNAVIIHGVYGNVTIDMLTDIEAMFNDPEIELVIPNATSPEFVGVVCQVYWDPGETQCGNAHGDVITFPGYWDFDIVGYAISGVDNIIKEYTIY